MKTFENIQASIMEILRWATNQPDVEALALVGSYARGAASGTSDIDLVLISNHPEKYLTTTSWIEQFGKALRYQVEDYGRLTSVRVWYTDGREFEYGITTPEWAQIPLDPGTRQVIQGGFRVLLDKRGLFDNLGKPWPTTGFTSTE